MRHLLNGIRMSLIRKLALRMCDGYDCKNCKAYLGPNVLPVTPCAMVHVLEQAINLWGVKKEDYNASKN